MDRYTGVGVITWGGVKHICKGKADINNDIDINDNVSALNVVNKVEGYQIRRRGQSNLEGGFNNIRKEKRTNKTGGMELI